MELVLAGESRLDTTDLDKKKASVKAASRWFGKAAFRNCGRDKGPARVLRPSTELVREASDDLKATRQRGGWKQELWLTWV